jgi:hypothetical protein
MFPLALVCGLTMLAACDSFDKDVASLQIREEFCRDWPYGCTETTEVEIEKVNKTRNGRQVEFRVVDREDETARLSAAYFEIQDEEWDFLLFENPFNERFKLEAAQVGEDSRLFADELQKLKRAQNWFLSIYGRYARSIAELDSVSFKPPELPIDMSVSAASWQAELSSQYVRCVLDVSRQQLPDCKGLSAENAGAESGPLSQAFGEGG